ncbi:MAG: hypothetical protein HY877_03060 [Deltaproteobacteria bacterium]|nr:hypothetical protein [Deltaproteobacteria bacterium]
MENTALKKFSPEVAAQRGFKNWADRDGDGLISEGDTFEIPFKGNGQRAVRMLGIRYDQTHGHLLGEVLAVDSTQHGTNYAFVTTEGCMAYAEFSSDRNKPGFGYFTSMLFGDQARAKLSALRLLQKPATASTVTPETPATEKIALDVKVNS